MLLKAYNLSAGLLILAHFELAEESYTVFSPTYSGILHFAAEYNLIDNLYFKLGFETTLRGWKVYPYTLKVTGFTESTTQGEHVLNDFKMSNTYTSFSVGVAYVIGFGRYR